MISFKVRYANKHNTSSTIFQVDLENKKMQVIKIARKRNGIIGLNIFIIGLARKNNQSEYIKRFNFKPNAIIFLFGIEEVEATSFDHYQIRTKSLLQTI